MYMAVATMQCQKLHGSWELDRCSKVIWLMTNFLMVRSLTHGLEGTNPSY